MLRLSLDDRAGFDFDSREAPDKTSDLDPVPTWLVQEFAPFFAPFFAHVFNVSFERVIFLLHRKRRLFIRALRQCCFS